MLSGKRFRLESPTAAIEKVDGKDVAVIIPAGVIIKVISGPRHGSAMMDVLFDGRVVMVFSTDVEQRGTELVA